MTDLNYTMLDKEMDRCKTRVFLSKNAAFLGPLMCSVNFLWTEDIHTAQTNGSVLYWNPKWFLKLPDDTRQTVLLHELWHVALLHMIRRGTRDPKVWNYACDYNINNMLDLDGMSFKGTRPLLDHQYGEMSAEEIYDVLIQMPAASIGGTFLWGHEVLDEHGVVTGDTEDILEPDEATGSHALIGKVVQAATAAKMAGASEDGSLSEVETMLKRFLQPKLPWEQLLYRFFNDMTGQDYSWARPNRRYRDMYLPSLQEDDTGLDHLIYYLDVSGSVSDGEVVRFNSEVKHIKDTFNPARLTLVLFDDKIQREYEFLGTDPFEEVVIVGRGGTDLGPVRDHMILHKPQAAIVFSDLCCEPMALLPPEVTTPVIWVGVNAYEGAHVHFGKLIHIKE